MTEMTMSKSSAGDTIVHLDYEGTTYIYTAAGDVPMIEIEGSPAAQATSICLVRFKRPLEAAPQGYLVPYRYSPAAVAADICGILHIIRERWGLAPVDLARFAVADYLQAKIDRFQSRWNTDLFRATFGPGLESFANGIDLVTAVPASQAGDGCPLAVEIRFE